jgi:hypothetical protein
MFSFPCHNSPSPIAKRYRLPQLLNTGKLPRHGQIHRMGPFHVLSTKSSTWDEICRMATRNRKEGEKLGMGLGWRGVPALGETPLQPDPLSSQLRLAQRRKLFLCTLRSALVNRHHGCCNVVEAVTRYVILGFVVLRDGGVVRLSGCR